MTPYDLVLIEDGTANEGAMIPQLMWLNTITLKGKMHGLPIRGMEHKSESAGFW